MPKHKKFPKKKKKIKLILLFLINFFKILTSLKEIKNKNYVKTTPKHINFIFKKKKKIINFF